MALGVQVVFDVADPARQAEFWALALGYQVQPPPPGFDSWDAVMEALKMPKEQWDSRSAVVDPDGAGPRIFFQRVPEGKTVKNRVHLDINASAPEHGTEAGWKKVTDHVKVLTAAGATVVREVNEPLGRCIVMQDPEGNEFCVQ